MEWLPRMEDWQQQRQPEGLDPYDWEAFRMYAISSYGRDPGIVPLTGFLEYEADDTERQQQIDKDSEETETLAAGLEKSASE
jgi:hypothetical protein